MEKWKRHKGDFKHGVTIGKSTAVAYIYYTSEYDGSSYETTFPVTVDDVEIEFTILIVKNEVEYGIYSIHVEA